MSAERDAIRGLVEGPVREALAMSPEAREATFAVLCSAIAAADGIATLRVIVASTVDAIERRMREKGKL